ncbi:hypothetical protein [Pseudoduganella namucuonensis]|uniref:Uncharacterized protein n=1 Tax=Pseudoduganella namucuonensis TaxID=1035707 RepID=A0A1I7J2R8_9BURK|nr:hypothetical protein [Pseudoduganella namucuonensis]SFU79499.1 hypothetical protein SAMN05216552_101010 [Pseudoduganella namucuonensis]
MNHVSETCLLLEERLKATSWQIVTTVMWGVMAAALAIFGQHCLEQARPIFPMIDQNFGLWQNGYAVALLAFALAWLAALMQKLNLLLDCRDRLKVRQRIDEENARREQAREERRAQRLQAAAAAAAEPEIVRPRRVKAGRSTKFDY